MTSMWKRGTERHYDATVADACLRPSDFDGFVEQRREALLSRSGSPP